MMFRVPPLPGSVFSASFFTAASAPAAARALSTSCGGRPQRFRPRSAPGPHVPSPSDPPLSPNDEISTHVRNRNPMNLERMLIGYKPKGFQMEKSKRAYWNRLDLSIKGGHTTAVVKHWTGREVCRASTKEWAINKFLYNYTDAAALQIVAKVLGQRALQTGISEVFLEVSEQDLKKERMRKFVEAVEGSGLTLSEGAPYKQVDPHRSDSNFNKRFKPWEVIDE